jgi:hypothetical protein
MHRVGEVVDVAGECVEGGAALADRIEFLLGRLVWSWPDHS